MRSTAGSGMPRLRRSSPTPPRCPKLSPNAPHRGATRRRSCRSDWRRPRSGSRRVRPSTDSAPGGFGRTLVTEFDESVPVIRRRAESWWVSTGPLPGQLSSASVALAIFMPWSKFAFHSATASSSKLSVDRAIGSPNSSLSLTNSTRFSILGRSSPKIVRWVRPRAAHFMLVANSRPTNRRARARSRWFYATCRRR